MLMMTCYTFLVTRLNKTGQIKQILHCDFEKVTKWSYENYIVLRRGKCHFMCLGRSTENKTFIFKNKTMQNSETQSY